ncbi:MAG: DUF6285 domain-containing protein [Dehalococcoidia bacterium]
MQAFLEDDVMPASEGSRRFNARVAANTLRIVRRELQLEDEQLAAEWRGLDALLGEAERPEGRAALREALRSRNEALCERIRAGHADAGAFRDRVVEHVRRTVRDKLLVTNPRWIGEGEEG